MLFNIVLLPIELFFIYMIIKVKDNISKSHFYTDKGEKYLRNIHEFDEDYIKIYNKKYILPYLYINLFILVIMSISTLIFEKEIYHKFIIFGFIAYFVVIVVFGGLGMLNMNKKMNKWD